MPRLSRAANESPVYVRRIARLPTDAAVWAEMDVVLSDEFATECAGADGSVDGGPSGLRGRHLKTVTSYYYRGDSACHEKKLLRWLLDEKREDGPRDSLVLRSARG